MKAIQPMMAEILANFVRGHGQKALDTISDAHDCKGSQIGQVLAIALELTRPPGAALTQATPAAVPIHHAKTFPEIVAEFIAVGEKKSAAIEHAIQHFPAEYESWRRAGSGPL